MLYIHIIKTRQDSALETEHFYSYLYHFAGTVSELIHSAPVYFDYKKKLKSKI